MEPITGTPNVEPEPVVEQSAQIVGQLTLDVFNEASGSDQIPFGD